MNTELVNEDKNQETTNKNEESIDHLNDLSIETKERDDQLQKIRDLSWKERVFREMQKGSLRGVIVMFLRLTLGAGIFTLPYYVSSFGYLLGFLFIICAAGINLWSYYDIIDASDETKSKDYFDLIDTFLGRKFVNVFKFTYFLDLILTVTGVQIVCYKLLQFCMGFMNLTDASWFIDANKGIWNEDHPTVLFIRKIFFGLLLILSIPFLLKKELFFLQKVNFLILIALMLMLGYSILEFPFFFEGYIETTTRTPIKAYQTNWWENFAALMLSFYAQPFIFSLKGELMYPTKSRMKKMARITMGIEVLLFLVIGVCGYFVLGDTYTPEVLYARQPYPGKSMLTEGIYRSFLVFFFCCVLLGLAIYNPTIRDYLYQTLPLNKNDNTTYILASLLPFTVITFIAYLKPSVTFIFNLCGVTICNFNGFILPALIQLKRHWEPRNTKIVTLQLIKLSALLLMSVFGIYYMIV